MVRTDLDLGKGKLAVQVAHASVESFLRTPEKDRKKWLQENQKKVVLKVGDEEQLTAVYEKARRAGLPSALIQDAGLTQIPPGTKTTVGIGPAEEGEIDKITGELALL